MTSDHVMLPHCVEWYSDKGSGGVLHTVVWGQEGAAVVTGQLLNTHVQMAQSVKTGTVEQ